MFDRLHFDNELGLHDEIHPIAALQGHALVSNRQVPLALEAQPAQHELVF